MQGTRGSARVLVVSPPALDIEGGRARPGGPGVYAGGALALLGHRVAAVGPVGYCTLPVASFESLVGVERLGYPVVGPGYVNELVYTGGGRIVRPLSRVPAFDPSMVARASQDYWDAIIVSPLWGEDPGALLGLLHSSTRLLVVDVQGYARAGVEPWLLYRGIQILHAGDGEPWEPGSASIVVATGGPGPVRVYWRGRLEGVYRPRPWRLRDPTGAGDVFTALLLDAILSGDTLEEAVGWALDMVGPVLERVQAVAGERGVPGAGHCG